MIIVVLITAFGYIIEVNKNDKVFKEEQPTKEADGKTDEGGNKENEPISVITVDIGGYVKNPGVYELNEGMRVNDAIEAAGGILEEADSEYVSRYINKARVLSDQEKLYIPKNGEDASFDTNNNENNPLTGKININTASKEKLMTLKGIGDAFAQRIIDYRKTKKFINTEDLKNVKGIGDKTFERLKDYITVD